MRSQEDDEYADDQPGLDEENLEHNLNDFDTEGLAVEDSRMTVDSAAFDTKDNSHGARRAGGPSRNSGRPAPKWPATDEDVDNDVPASLLVEANEAENHPPASAKRARQYPNPRTQAAAGPSSANVQAQWDAATTQQRLHRDDPLGLPFVSQPRGLITTASAGSPREKALWRWVNTSNLDSFMRDVYDYYEGGGLLCILCANALWLL